jgi:hypothetical protein
VAFGLSHEFPQDIIFEAAERALLFDAREFDFQPVALFAEGIRLLDCPRKSVEMQEVLQGADCREGDEIAPRHGVSRNFFQNVIHERHRFRFGRDDRPMT